MMSLLHNSRISLLKISALMAVSLALLLLSCVKQKEIPELPDEPIVAKIADRAITAKEFRNSYETGFAHLKTGPDPKKAYLEYMINEKLLALKG